MSWNGAMLGYRLKDGRYEIVPKEAALVRRIYNEYLAGDGYQAVAKRLTEEGVLSRFGGKWNQSVVSKILSNYTYTGNLLLQKTFRENHIMKKTVINHGELPKYHAEDSTDRYRRTIWQCNSKFKVEERCHTPTVNTETVQRLFTQAYNGMMENREQIIKDCETMRRALTDFAELDAEIERQLEETQVVAELVKAAVKENASTAQSQEAYLRKYEALTERYEKAAAELERLQNLRTTQSQQDKAMALYIRTLKKQPVVLREWSDTIWTVMVEKAIVHRNGAITFVFKNGTEVKVGE